MTLIVLTPAVAAHLAVSGRRQLKALESTPNLPSNSRQLIAELHATVDQLDDVAKGGQPSHFLAVRGENGKRDLLLGDAASASKLSVRTLRRRIAERVLQSRWDGHRIVIDADELARWIEDGKPHGRTARRS